MKSILNMSEAASLAIHALIVLATDCDGRMSTAELAAELEVSEAHLSKVLQRLTRAGFISAQRGPSGGYTLDCDPSGVTILEVYEFMEGPIREPSCLLDLDAPHGDRCCFKPLLRDVTRLVREHMGSRTLTDVVRTLKGEPAGVSAER